MCVTMGLTWFLVFVCTESKILLNMIGFIVIHNDLRFNISLYPSVNPAKFTDNKTRLNLSAVYF